MAKFELVTADEIRAIIREELSTIAFPKPIEMEDKLLSIREVTELLNISKTTFKDWRKKGLVPYIRKGRRIYVRNSELMQSMKSNKLSNRNG